MAKLFTAVIIAVVLAASAANAVVLYECKGGVLVIDPTNCH